MLLSHATQVNHSVLVSFPVHRIGTTVDREIFMLKNNLHEKFLCCLIFVVLFNPRNFFNG